MLNFDLNRISYFVGVVEAGSFTAAADKLDVNKAVVSHQVAKLEAELKTTLLMRTTRRLQTTEAGQLFYDRCLNILRDVEFASGELMSGAETPSGTLTLTAPIAYGTRIVAGAISKYLKQFPQMKVSANFDEVRLDQIENQLDLSISLGALKDSTAQARRLGSFERYVVCSPEFSRQLGPIQSPKELAKKSWIMNRSVPNPTHLRFSNANRQVVVTDIVTAVTTNRVNAVHALAIAGAGIAPLPDYVVASDIKAGRLVRLIPKWKLPALGIYIVYPNSRFRPAKVRTFVDILVRHIREISAGRG